jgi:hypothetical protein
MVVAAALLGTTRAIEQRVGEISRSDRKRD